MDIPQWLNTIDKQLFSFVQEHLAATWLDGVMLLLRNPLTWIPFYAFMLFWCVRNGKRREKGAFILLTLLTFAICDFTSASILKPILGRIRPCYDPDLQLVIRPLLGCGGKYSFPSSHAANHFGLATCWFWCIWLMKGKKWHWLWVWAALIGFAQVYVGKHYPFDIAAGMLLGLVVGTFTARCFEWWCFLPRQYSRNRGMMNMS
jgi:undecaprenyl-diphosphatase